MNFAIGQITLPVVVSGWNLLHGDWFFLQVCRVLALPDGPVGIPPSGLLPGRFLNSRLTGNPQTCHFFSLTLIELNLFTILYCGLFLNLPEVPSRFCRMRFSWLSVKSLYENVGSWSYLWFGDSRWILGSAIFKFVFLWGRTSFLSHYCCKQTVQNRNQGCARNRNLEIWEI